MQDTSHMDTLTSEALLMSRQMTLPGIDNATSLPESEDGRTHSDLLDGQMTKKCGLDHAHASHFQAPQHFGQRGVRTIATSGRIGRASLLQIDLESCLASRWSMRAIGLMRFAMTWKALVTRSGRQFSRLAVSVSTMRAIGFILYATPTATANQASPAMQKKWIGCRGIEVSPRSWRSRMGYPVEWAQCEPMGTPSFRRSPRK